jgi:colicin import membrane protein
MKGKGFRIIVATILSTVIHFFILTLLDTIPLISKEIPQRNLYMVDLVPLAVEQPAPQKSEEPAVQQKEEEVKKEEVKKEEVKKEVKKEEPKQETVKQEEKKDTVVLEDPNKNEATPEKATKGSTEKPTVNDEQQQLASAIKGIEEKVADRETDAPVVTDDEINRYKVMIQERVKRFWVIPDTLSEKELEAVIIIEIDQKGYMKGTPQFEKSSGNVVFDQAAMRAIRNVTSFPPPPGQIPLKFGLKFP